MTNLQRVSFAVALTLGSACSLYSADDPEAERCEPREAELADPAGEHLQYVVSSIVLPTDATSSNRFGLNLDGDDQGRPDNAMGSVLSTLSYGDLGYDLNDETQLLVDAGEILHLLDIQTVSTDDATGVGVRLAHARDTDGDASDNFSGEEVFGLDDSRGSGYMAGAIEDGWIRVELGRVPLAVTLPGLDEPFIFELEGAKLEAFFTEEGLEGRIGGGITQADVDTKLIPVFQDGLMRIVDRDCDQEGCIDGSFGQTLVDLFDENDDLLITEAELRDNSVTNSLLALDVDLFDDDGHLAPRCDELKDSLSIGIAFLAVPAEFPFQ